MRAPTLLTCSCSVPPDPELPEDEIEIDDECPEHGNPINRDDDEELER